MAAVFVIEKFTGEIQLNTDTFWIYGHHGDLQKELKTKKNVIPHHPSISVFRFLVFQSICLGL